MHACKLQNEKCCISALCSILHDASMDASNQPQNLRSKHRQIKDAKLAQQPRRQNQTKKHNKQTKHHLFMPSSQVLDELRSSCILDYHFSSAVLSSVHTKRKKHHCRLNSQRGLECVKIPIKSIIGQIFQVHLASNNVVFLHFRNSSCPQAQSKFSCGRA